MRALQENEVEKPFPQELALAEGLRAQGELDEAIRVCVKYMGDHFDDVQSIAMAAHICINAGRIGLAHALLSYALKLDPRSNVLWNNLGLCYQEGSDLEKGEAAFLRALSLDMNDAAALNNLAQLYVNTAQPQKAINCADKAIRLEPALDEARYNKGMANLLLRNWKEGWEGYEYNLGPRKFRRERVYGDVPRWDGSKGKTVVVYTEQGIGDALQFASCLPDAIRDCKVVIECEPRQVGLFQRSFGVPCYGTVKEDHPAWLRDHKIDAKCAIGSLPKFYRNADVDFPGTPYLKADPQRRLMYRALLDSMGPKKKVGIAWTGGLKNTCKARRSLAIDDMKPILAQDATFISLQYVAAPEAEAFNVHHWPFAMQTKDYDDTAALVSELDLVITVQQTIVHTAGALGVPAWMLTPSAPLWKYGVSGDTMPWYNSVKLYRQNGAWVHTISDIASDLRKWLSQ